MDWWDVMLSVSDDLLGPISFPEAAHILQISPADLGPRSPALALPCYTPPVMLDRIAGLCRMQRVLVRPAMMIWYGPQSQSRVSISAT